MDAEKIIRDCENAKENLSKFEFTDDPKQDLIYINANLKTATLTRIAKRARYFAGSLVAALAVAALTVGAVLAADAVMRIAFAVCAAALAVVSAFLSLTHLFAATHKAVCIVEDGKVKEFIYCRNGAFIYNTLEKEISYFCGKTTEKKHGFSPYRPMYPYMDFFDRDYSAYLKARTGRGYEGGEVCDRNERGELCAYFDSSRKKRKFALKTENGIPEEMDYLSSEKYIYRNVNEPQPRVYIPNALKKKIKISDAVKAEYYSDEESKSVWQKV